MPPRRTSPTGAAPAAQPAARNVGQIIDLVQQHARPLLATGIDPSILPLLTRQMQAPVITAQAAMTVLRDQHMPGTMLDFERASDSSGSLRRITRAVEQAQQRSRFR